MSNPLTRLLQEPPPSHVFEVSEGGIAFSNAGQIGFRPFEEGVLAISPARDNLQKPDSFAAHVGAMLPRSAKRRGAALILPDYAARVQVLDFDSFPSNADEQLSLIKFRVKKTVPFDIDSAVVSYHAQPSARKKIDVVAATMALEIVARYEAPFRNANYQPGLITTSSLAALNLAPPVGLSIIAKLSGKVLNVMAQDGQHLRLARTVELEQGHVDEILAVLHPTIAFVEDELSSPPEKLLWIGHAADREQLQRELGIPVEQVQSRYGQPGEFNAGLLGYLQGAVQ